jgi:VCBS repeat protein
LPLVKVIANAAMLAYRTRVMVTTGAASTSRVPAAHSRIALAVIAAAVAGCGSEARPDGSRGTVDAGQERSTGLSDAPLDLPTGTRHAFRRIRIGSEFYCEGATYGDFDGDGNADVAFGPFWYEGPGFTARHEIYPPQVYDPHAYSDCFFLFSRDFDADGATDILRVGFPGTDASWFANPGPSGGPWPRHAVVSAVDTESPYFVDITGDGHPELVFGADGRLVWAGPDPADATRPWTLHPMTPPSGFHPFTHGLGVGDVDGDGRSDVLEATSWWQQPPSLEGDPVWARRLQSFGSGGAQMAMPTSW